MIHAQTRDPKKEAPFSYVEHLIHLAPLFAPPQAPLGYDKLTRLFPDMNMLIPVGRCYLSLLAHMTKNESPMDFVAGTNFVTKKNIRLGFETACKHYIDRITQTAGHFSHAQAVDITRLVLSIYHFPVFTDFAQENSWDQVLLKTVAEHTPAIRPPEKARLLGFADLAQTEALSYKLPKSRARALIAKVTPFLANEAEINAHAMWAFPILANAYHALKMPEECLQTWREFEKAHPQKIDWCHRDLCNALFHMSEYSQSPQEIAAWWQKYLDLSRLNFENFRPDKHDLSAMFNVIEAYVRLEHNEAAEFLARKLSEYFDHDGAALTKTEHYAVRQFTVSLQHARALTNLGRYEEAARIYENYFEWDQNHLYIRYQRATSHLDRARLAPLLKEDAQTAVVALVQSGRIKPETRGHGRKTASHKSRPKGPARSAREGISIANAARAHLMSHYKQRLDSTLAHLNGLITACTKMQNTDALREHLGALKDQGAALKSAATHASATTQSSPSSSHASPPPSVDLIELGQRVDDLHSALDTLQKAFDEARLIHKAQTQKALDAYFAQLHHAEDDAAVFVPTPTPGPSTPVARAPKIKTRGAPVASSSTQAPTPPQTEHPEDAPQLFMGKHARGDYEKLDSHLLEKFHALAHEITLNPYQIIGGQGRPERLVTRAGVYLSRKLTDGDRVVYELTKDTEGKVRVIFVSLLGHYKHLARQIG